jgi:alpha-L-fucosidase
VRFTTKGNVLYAYIMGWPEARTVIRSLATGTELAVGKVTSVEMLGNNGEVTSWNQDGSGLTVGFAGIPPSGLAVGLRIRGALA